MKSERMTIGVFGHYGNKNIGDESIIEAVIQNIRRRNPFAKIYGFSIVPEDTKQRHGVEAFPIRYRHIKTASEQTDEGKQTVGGGNGERTISPGTDKSLLSVLKASIKRRSLVFRLIKSPIVLFEILGKVIREIYFLRISYERVKVLDVLMITGSNQFLDNFGGPWGFPYTLLKWSVLAKIAKVKVCFVCIGAGPITHKLSKIFIRWTLLFADYVSLRDFSSKKLVHEIGYNKKTYVYPDIAHSLDIGDLTKTELPNGVKINDLPIVGINPMPLYDPRYWCEKDGGKYSAYVEKLVIFAEKLLGAGYPFYFFSTQEKDNNVIIDVLKKLGDRNKTIFKFNDYALKSDTVAELISNIASADITVATRFHGTVLSLLSEKPMLGVWYHKKIKELMLDMGQAEYAVELDTFSVEDLWDRFETLVLHLPAERLKIQCKNAEYVRALQQQYDKLLAI